MVQPVVRRAELHETAALMFQRPEDIERAIHASSAMRGLVRSGVTSWVLNYASGSFSRTATAWQQLSAPTTGSVAFMQTVAANTAAYSNLGDGAGSMIRIEGARTNICPNSRAWPAGSGAGGALVTNGLANATDATSSASRSQCAGGGQFSTHQTLNGGVSVRIQYSAWIRGNSAASNWSPGVYGTITSFAIAGTTYEFHSHDQAAGANANFYYSDTTLGAAANDVLGDHFQAETGSVTFPSSPITTGAGTATRDADVLMFTTAQLPATIFTRPAEFLQVSPEFANTDLASGDTFVLWSAVDGNNCIRIKHDGTNVVVQAVAGGTVKASSGALTFARNALLGVVKWDPLQGLVYVNGTAGAAGTPWSWAAGTSRLGGINGGASEAFCRFGQLQSA